MNGTILILDGISERVATLLEQSEFECEIRPTLPKDDLYKVLPEFDAVAVRSATKIDRAFLERPGKLKLVVRGGVGVDNIDIEAASQNGVAVANTPGANTIATAELTMALMLAMSRNIVPAHNSLAQNEWNRSQFRGFELAEKILGLIGFGRVGREVARRAQAFSMNVLAYDPYLPTEAFTGNDVQQVELPELYRQADYISLHLPVTDSTRKLIDADALSQMKERVRILNCARGGLLDDAAVAEALDAGKIAGVAIDVYPTEPPKEEYPLLNKPGVVHLPHLGASTFEAQTKVGEEVVRVIKDYFIHSAMDAVINKKELM